MKETRPDAAEANALVRAALALLQNNQPAAAEGRCREALALQPRHLGALGVLGSALHSLERYAEAESVFDDLTRHIPSEPLYWMNLGTARRCGGRYDAALSAYAQAAQLGCATADFFYNVGLTHLDRHDYEAARAVLARAAQLAPDDAEIRLQYAKACYESLQTDEAIAALSGWQNLQGLDPEVVAHIGHKLTNLGEPERAQPAVEQLLQTPDLEPRAALTLAQILERTNRVSEARTVLDRLAVDSRAAGLGPELALMRAQLAQRESRHDEACTLFRQSLAAKSEFHSRHFDLFPLAKSLDALGRYEETFATLIEAHRSQIEYVRLTAPAAAARGALTMTITQYGCDAADVAMWDQTGAPPAGESPIFIVAFPRSGTTLLEQTLDAHPLLKSLDEQPVVQRALDDIVAAGIRYPEQLARLDQPRLDSVRANYLERARAKVRLDPGQRLVDKNPLNLLRLPVIRRVFPHARIILAIRHPCDVVLSCFMQHFRAPEFALMCGDLATLAAGYRRSFDFWYAQAQLLQPAVREVRYEAFVADFAGHVRELAEFLELSWDDAMLQPGKHAAAKGFISTPSYSQVVQPVTTKSIGRWKPYEKFFAPILPQLQPYLERWDYEA